MARKRIFMIYKQHAVCFRCRVALKDITECPHCRQPMVSVGQSFKAPRRHQIHAWKQLSEQYKWLIDTADQRTVARTHSVEYENEVARRYWDTPWWNVRFSRKLTPRKKNSE